MTGRCLILIYGGAFRNRQKTPAIGEAEISNQRIATASHLGMIRYLQEAFHYACDVRVVTYHTPHDKQLKDWYRTEEMIFLDRPMPTAIDLYQFALRSAAVNDSYDFLLFLRTDIALKEYFKGVFRPHHDQVMVSFPSCNDDRQPWHWVGDMLGFIPRELFHLSEKGFYFYHNAYFQLRRWGLSHKLGVYVASHHRPHTGNGWNPLYYLPARPLNKKIDRPFMRDMLRQEDFPYDPAVLYDVESIDARIMTSPDM